MMELGPPDRGDLLCLSPTRALQLFPILPPMLSPKSRVGALSWASQLLSCKRPSWKCVPGRNARPTSVLRSRSFATAPTDAPKKSYYVTTPIFYVNAGMSCFSLTN